MSAKTCKEILLKIIAISKQCYFFAEKKRLETTRQRYFCFTQVWGLKLPRLHANKSDEQEAANALNYVKHGNTT